MNDSAGSLWRGRRRVRFFLVMTEIQVAPGLVPFSLNEEGAALYAYYQILVAKYELHVL